MCNVHNHHVRFYFFYLSRNVFAASYDSTYCLRSKEMSCKEWLKKHGLVAQRLTILDALAPTLIRHRAKYIPILDKHVVARVFDEVSRKIK